MSTKRTLAITALEGYPPEIGRWLWSLEDVRRGLKEEIQGMAPEMLDHQPPGANGIGTLLYHIAVIEADWLYEDVLGRQWAPDIAALFPFEVRTADGALTPVRGERVEQHLHRLDAVRSALLAEMRRIDLADWRHPREMAAYTVTPEWAIYHLIEHEAAHRGQIVALARQLKRFGTSA